MTSVTKMLGRAYVDHDVEFYSAIEKVANQGRKLIIVTKYLNRERGGMMDKERDAS